MAMLRIVFEGLISGIEKYSPVMMMHKVHCCMQPQLSSLSVRAGLRALQAK
jgi:hypothetical protein